MMPYIIGWPTPKTGLIYSGMINNKLTPQNNRMNRKGINVEYEKNISEKEEQLKNKIKKEVDRFTIRDDR